MNRAVESTSRTNKVVHMTPIESVEYIKGAFAQLIEEVKEGNPDSFTIRVISLCNRLQLACEKDADATLGMVFMNDDSLYSVRHPVNTAIVSEIVAKQLGMPNKERLILLAGALTSNIGMIELQDTLYCQQEKLTDLQRQEVQAHPEKGAEMLRTFGVTTSAWINAVLHHHEGMDGKGYPGGLSADSISYHAKIIAVADQYCAAVSRRTYRDSLTADQAMKSIYRNSGNSIDAKIVNTCVKSLGIYPPGSFVELANRETAIVIKRGEKAHLPTVCSILREGGKLFNAPKIRDPHLTEFQVRKLITSESCGLKVDPYQLWGYEKPA